MITHDSAVIKSWITALGFDVAGFDRDVTQLPVRLGGLGLISARKVGTASFLGSLAKSLPLVKRLLPYDFFMSQYLTNVELSKSNAACSLAAQYQGCISIDDINEVINGPHASDPQKPLTSLIHNANLKRCLSTPGYECEKSHLVAAQQPLASEYLRSIPYDPVLKCSNIQYSTMIRLKLGKNFPGLSPICRSCNVDFDRSTDHAFNCSFGGDTNRRHNAIRDEILSHSHGGGVITSAEPQRILGQNDGRKPADVFVKNFLNGKDACFDVTVTNVATFKNLFKAYGRGENVGNIARKGYNTKITKSKNSCEELGYLFYPIAFESTGGIVTESIDTLKTFCNRVCSGTSTDPKTSFKTLMKRISMVLQKNNAKMILDRLTPATHAQTLDSLLHSVTNFD